MSSKASDKIKIWFYLNYFTVEQTMSKLNNLFLLKVFEICVSDLFFGNLSSENEGESFDGCVTVL